MKEHLGCCQIPLPRKLKDQSWSKLGSIFMSLVGSVTLMQYGFWDNSILCRICTVGIWGSTFSEWLGSLPIKRGRTSGSSPNVYIDTHTDHAAFIDTLGGRFILVRRRSWGWRDTDTVIRWNRQQDGFCGIWEKVLTKQHWRSFGKHWHCGKNTHQWFEFLPFFWLMFSSNCSIWSMCQLVKLRPGNEKVTPLIHPFVFLFQAHHPRHSLYCSTQVI